MTHQGPPVWTWGMEETHANPSVKTITSLEEWEACKEENAGKSVLLQCGSPVCTRCPAFTRTIEGLKTEWQFVHVYVNTHAAEEDLIEELRVTQLPAYVLISDRDSEKAEGQASTPQEIEVAIRTLCTPVFTTDEDF